MSRGFKSRAHQIKKMELLKQGTSAPKGVSYCDKCERRRIKKQKRSRVPQIDPPMCIVYIWLLICGAFYRPDAADIFLLCVKNISIFLFTCVSIFDCFSLIISSYRKITRPVLEPQSGTSKMDPYLKEAIQVWCLFESLRDAKTKRGMVAAIIQYMQSHVKESLFLYCYRQLMRIEYISDWSSDDGYAQVESMIEEAFGNDSIREAKDELLVLDPQDGSLHEIPWHRAMEDAFTNWKTFKQSHIANKFLHLINVIVSCGMCATSDLTFKVGNVSLFTPIIYKKQLAAGDVFEAFYEAVSGFMKGGWRVFQTGEVSAFFSEDDKILEFDRMYNDIKSFHGYALAGNLREYTDIEENEYDVRLKAAVEFGENLLKCVSKSQLFERKYISDRLDKIRDNQTEFTQLRVRGGLRIAPFAISLFGQSGCGKSCLTNLTVNAGLLYNGLSADKDRIATWADNDKFASSIRSHINAIVFDDFANTKSDFMDFSPAYRLIQVINNIKYLAPMADVFLKGKVSLNPYFCIVSTNVEHLNAAKYSNEPESVLRRMYHVKVEPKPYFCEKGILSKEKIEKTFGHTPCPDAWFLTIRTYTARNKRHVDLSAMTPVIFEGRPMVKVSVHTYLKWVQMESKKHFAEERQYIANQESIPTRCKTCDLLYCNCAPITEDDEQEENIIPITKVDERCVNGYCTKCGAFHNETVPLEPHSGNFAACKNFFELRAEKLKNSFQEAVTSTVLATNAVCLWFEKFDLMPEHWISHPFVLKCGLIFWRKEIHHSLIAGNSFFFIMMLLSFWYIPNFSFYTCILALFLMYWFTCATIQTYQKLVRLRLLDLKDVVHTYTQSWQLKYAIIGLGAIGIILTVMRAKYKKLDAHAGLQPENMNDIHERNSAVNPWLVSETVPLPMSVPSKTTTSENLAASMRTNIIGIVSDLEKVTLGFFITSNFLLVPTHYLEHHGDRDIDIKCYRTVEGEVGRFFRDKISMAYKVDIPTTDFSLCFVTSGGSMKDYRKFLPTGNVLKRCAAKMVTRDTTGSSLQAIPTLFKGSGIIAHTLKTFLGGLYELPIETAKGMCMSPVISDEKGSTILGFHLGGRGKIGGCGILTRDQVDCALSELSMTDGVVLSASSGDLNAHMGDFPTSVFGKDILEKTEIHPKSAVNFLTKGACVDVYGTTIGRATPHSNVVPTLISESVEKHFGVPQQWGPPKMKGPGRYPYQATLVHSAIPSLPIGSVMAKAVASMKGLTTGLKKLIPDLFQTCPLTRVATVSGLAGVRFIDAMNYSTSPGFPFGGNKNPLLIDLDPKDYPDVGRPRTFIPEIWDEFERVKKILMSGERCYMIWKACLKDEATKLDKDKVRVFQSAPLVMQLLIRMYFLPIVRIIQLNPILYECAVGTNSEGLEWEELWESAMSKGKDRVLAGDYSKYDVRMPAQVTIAAFDVLIDIAKQCEGYTPEDIHLMQMIVNEVVYPVMAYNGDLIQLFGTNPSGQNLTVIINSIVNSLLLRCCFFTHYPNRDFKEDCAMMTYGDDVIGTISEFCEKFNHIAFAEFLAKFDMKFTMPDKESTPTPYMKEEDVDFLKRKCAYNEDLGQKVGLLSEDSIFKRLHSHILSKELTMETHSATNIETSLHDWFFYGRDIFEDRREKLRLVAQDCGIEHLCPALNVSYDKRVLQWRHKYLGEPLEEQESFSLE